MATYTVTTLDDEAFEGSETQDAPDGAGLSLREALALANADPGADTITFAADLADGTIMLTQGQLTIASDVTIDGDLGDDGAPNVTVDADGRSRVFEVSDGASTIDGLVITGGYALVGGGVDVDSDASLSVTNSVVLGMPRPPVAVSSISVTSPYRIHCSPRILPEWAAAAFSLGAM